MQLQRPRYDAGSVRPMALYTYDVTTERIDTPLPSSRAQLMQEQQPDLITYSMQASPQPHVGSLSSRVKPLPLSAELLLTISVQPACADAAGRWHAGVRERVCRAPGPCAHLGSLASLPPQVPAGL